MSAGNGGNEAAMAVSIFDARPEGWTDEEGEFASVTVTAATATADAARDWLVEHAGDVLNASPEDYRVRPDHVELRGLTGEIPTAGLLPDTVDVETWIREGHGRAWWRFDVSMALEEIPGADERFEARMARWNREARERATEWRGPWWWRARCRAADLIGAAFSKVDPPDRSSVNYREDGQIVIAEVRRPAA